MPMKRFPHKYQIDAKDCGPTCLYMVARYYGSQHSIHYYRNNSLLTKEGISMLRLSEAAHTVGFETVCARISLEQLVDEIALPCILHWNHNHYVVCYAVKKKRNNTLFYLADPSMGKRVVSEDEMKKSWLVGLIEEEQVGIAMQLEPTEDFYKSTKVEDKDTPRMFYRFMPYILPHKWKIIQMLVATLIIMAMSYLLPLISQLVVDIGVQQKNISFIMLMMGMQLAISVLTTSIQFIQSWVALNMHTVINIKLIANYLSKLARMPIQFFERRTLGDILQRIGDHDRIKAFLMNDLIGILFSVATFITFSIVLFIYNPTIFTLFFIGTSLHVAWILCFMKYRREIDHRIFEQSSLLQNNLVQFIQGMQEIKMNNLERKKRWEWEKIQAQLYYIGVRSLRISQIQSAGSFLISTTSNIAISYLTATMVLSGELTLGMMVSLAFIIGQVAAPISSFIGFAQSYQDAQISIERLSDLYMQKDETQFEETTTKDVKPGDITISDVSFSYSGRNDDHVLHHISITIPQGKTTAIVGASGCGKTTLVKLIQGFYSPTSGSITIGSTGLNAIDKSAWRNKIGAVMQDGYIFADTIAKNISLTEDIIDFSRLDQALQVANLTDFIDRLPMGYDTKIGDEGMGISQGQKQRILIARSVYKNPDYIFFDEATNALDSKNEREIMQQVHEFYSGKTMIIVAHRLSTIRNADNIIVMADGKVIGEGKHEEILASCSVYQELINNQMTHENHEA